MMGEHSRISWTDHTFNPWIGCTKVSPGCANCYAEELALRWGMVKKWGDDGERRTTAESTWKKPLSWNRSAQKRGSKLRVFCGSMCDIFEDRDDLVEPRKRLFELIKVTPWLNWQMLTKRPENFVRRGFLPDKWWEDGPNPNVWLGVSIESDKYVHRAAHLKAVPAYTRFVSYEPALGPLDSLSLDGLHWVIYGGESGDKRRPEDKQWARSMRKRCDKAGVAFFHKQSSAAKPGQGSKLDGKTIHEFPEVKVYDDKYAGDA